MPAVNSSCLVVLASALSFSLAACTENEPADRGPIDLPGVSSSVVGTTLIEQDTPGDVVVVDVEQKITVEELAAVFEQIDELDPDDSTITLGCGTARIDTLPDDCDRATNSWQAPQGTPADGASVFLAAARAFPAAVVSVQNRESVDIDFAEPTSQDIAEALQAVRAEPVLARHADLSIGSGDRSPHPRFRVTTAQPLSPELVALWQQLRPTLSQSATSAPSGLCVKATAEGAIDVVSDLELPGVLPPEVFTPATHGGQVWPLAHAQLDVIAGEPAVERYGVRNEYRTVDGGPAFGNDWFISIAIGEAGEPDDIGRTWNVEAARYLSRLAP